MKRIVWLASYPENKLLPELNIIKKRNTHAAPWLVNLLDVLRKKEDFEFHVILSSSNIKESQSFEKDGVCYHAIKYSFPFSNRGFPNFFPYDSLTWYRSLRKRIKQKVNMINPDLIHVHGIEKGFGLCALDVQFPSIASIQGLYKEIRKVDPSIRGTLQSPIEKYVIKKSKNFGCRTEWDSGIIKSQNPEAKIYFMPELINKVFFKKKWAPTKSKRLVFVGSLNKRKGVEVLLKALFIIRKRIPEIMLSFIGSGSKKYVTKLKKQIEYMSLTKNVSFEGVISSEEIAEIHLKSDIFVLPTYIDNSPNSLAEAMAIGMPCIATNIGGIPSMIEHGESGFLFDLEDHNQLAGLVIKLLDNLKLSKEFGLKAHQKALEMNSESNVVEQTAKVYNEIINLSDE
jgi:glycosyltransferase involved in cell wall biosynthesis